MKLGICCVYFYGADGRWLLPMQLRFISETVAGYDYTIYAAANRLDSELKKILAASSCVQIVELPDFVGDANHEHAFFLDRLIDRAISDGCTHVAAFDSDSFPIVQDWPAVLLRDMGGDIRFAAVIRAENGDSHLPHPCGYFMHRSFYVERRPGLFPSDSEITSRLFREFIANTKQRFDTGIGYGYALWSSGEKWLQLHRSNGVNEHFLMAGIYGDVFFHLGASSRRPSFHSDYTTRLDLRVVKRIGQMPFLWRVGRFLEGNYLKENEKIFRGIVSQLCNGPDSFFAKIAGEDSGKFERGLSRRRSGHGSA